MHIKRGCLEEVASGLLAIEGVQRAYSTAGQYDMVALVKVADPDSLHRVVNMEMVRLTGIERTHTLTAFRCYDSDDLSKTFSVGFD